MTPKHFPGPWHRNIKPASKYPTIFACKNTHIAVIKTLGMTEEQIEAHADLIAAAPDLLEVVRVFVEKYDAAPDGALGIGLVNGDFLKARAAFARATGAQP